jgi:O-acetyl-ADP-ribose deacetylase (regulator of RNase III)
MIILLEGDITEDTNAEAIVTAANAGLFGGGGVDGAIHRAAGPTVLEECCLLGGCAPGDAKITSAGRLHAKHIIHAVGPVWKGGSSGEAELLACCYTRSIELAAEHDCKVVACPAISTGAYGYPAPEAARVTVAATLAALDAHPTVEEALFYLFDENTRRIFEQALHREKAWRAIEASPSAGQVLREDVDSISAMETRVAVPYGRHLTMAEAQRLHECVIPEGSDDRWFAFVAEGMLHLHRTWTGFHIFEARLVESADGGAELVDVWANDDADQRGVEANAMARHLDKTIKVLLDGAETNGP